MKYLLIITSFFITSCASISVTNLSNEPQYSKYLDREIILNNTGVICTKREIGNPKAAPDKDQLLFNEDGKCFHATTVTKAPENSTFHVKEIVMHHHFPPLWRHIYLIGSVKLPNKEIYDVYYFYGFDGAINPIDVEWLNNRL